jgi:uncharacterized protein (DUF952 family)
MSKAANPDIGRRSKGAVFRGPRFVVTCMPPASGLIYKLEDQAAWLRAQLNGHYTGSADDVRDGFIHFSTAEQTRVTAAKYFAGRTPLILAAIAVASLGDALRWEASRGGALFPHLYGPLAMTSVVWSQALALAPDGRHVFPMEMI